MSFPFKVYPSSADTNTIIRLFLIIDCKKEGEDSFWGDVGGMGGIEACERPF